MRSAFGIHLANGEGDLDLAIRTIGNGSYTLLHMEAFQLPELRRRAPEALILIRHYQPDWLALDPVAWAEECAQRYASHKAYTRHVTWANEQNLGDESGHKVGALPWRQATKADYETIHDWNLRFIRRFMELCPDAILHYPAFASGHSDDQNDYGFIGLEICRPGIDLCPILDRHYYPTLGTPVEDLHLGASRVELTKRLFPSKPLFISECGNFRVDDPRSPQHYLDMGYYWQGDSSVIGFTYFIASDPTKAHYQNDMSKNPRFFEVLETAVRVDKGPADPKVVYNIPMEPKPETGVMPKIGDGFRKASNLIGYWREDELYHFSGASYEVSLAVGERGYATWTPATNETVVHLNDGSLYSDYGNKGDGKLRKVK